MSSINPNNINGQYPIAGQDNDSQGFRDNFTNIKNNLTFAKSEIEDLQNKVLLKEPLSGTTLNNDLNNSILEGAQLKSSTETLNNLGTISSSDTEILWSDGHFQYFTLGASTEVTFGNWPASGTHTRLRLQVTVNSTAYTLTFANTTVEADSVTFNGLTSLYGADKTGTTNTITFPETGVYVYELSSYNNGQTVTIQELLRNRDTIKAITNYQYDTVANANAVSVNGSVSTVILNPVSLYAAANIKLPGNATVLDGQTISFSFGQTITAVTLWGNGATVSGAITAGSTTAPAKYTYVKPLNTWFKVA